MKYSKNFVASTYKSELSAVAAESMMASYSNCQRVCECSTERAQVVKGGCEVGNAALRGKHSNMFMYPSPRLYIVIPKQSRHDVWRTCPDSHAPLRQAGGIASSDQSWVARQEGILPATIIGAVDRVACFLVPCSQILACGLLIMA